MGGPGGGGGEVMVDIGMVDEGTFDEGMAGEDRVVDGNVGDGRMIGSCLGSPSTALWRCCCLSPSVECTVH